MKFLDLRNAALAMLLFLPTLTGAQETLVELPLSDQTRWEYFSDQVMGGVSEGRATFEEAAGAPILRLTGRVSTENRGGFIQARAKLEGTLPTEAKGVILNVRGNNETYYVHLRTSRTLLPWQFYQAAFTASETWQEVRIPFSDFAPYGRLLGKTFKVESVRSVAIVAFGKDYTADLSVKFVGIY
ncbi:CIA30 family protein [uncultured Sulfitobacter sp.]|uniref:CIA30 family protein n=1 Tax=uncultured Sulfitobacter sp. TaxID=191468 RepID=UPI0026190B1E|nr:CIA30 family protein [uncultured Sulfitobacter sp.]